MTNKLPTGVSASGDRFRAGIKINYKQYHLGTFEDVETAAHVRQQAKRMTDDLLKRIGEPEVVTKYVDKPITVVEYVEVVRPSIIDKLFRRKNARLQSDEFEE